MIRDYVALDLETSGLNPSENQTARLQKPTAVC